ncbi:hypothetical protein CLOSTMETH_03150 [[Clostridium] methylpentosum DSM 5476]|jgi:hypothetical protein|uniref:Uncharacterized protein n=1 Tax=[Clostridium] methylpentosum DSM 5476 TaxID=537013 RepID=C0EH05_9FIRM|nr:hypothetical protein CLOSTMETH_03150 [[Clostridium] methylpentosum DSM 5476]MDY3989010.1 hypothetical protein [Massilioclostridium sp.]MEE1492667.1 hypothetical protein [Massilioclostridium sp.]
MSKLSCDEQISHLLFELAQKKFKETECGKLLEQEKSNAEEVYRQFLCPSDLKYIQAAMHRVESGQQGENEFYYQQGYRDCFNLFKSLKLI